VAAADATTVRFKGSPERLTGLVPAPAAAPLDLEVRLVDLPAAFQSALPAYAQPLTAEPGGPALLRLALPSSTPPGTYTGTIRVGEIERSLAVEVEPLIRVRFNPVSLVLHGASGANVSAPFTLYNVGNSGFEVRRVYAFGVFDVDGLDDAFGHTFRTELRPGERRIDVFAEKLAEGHGGLVRVRIEKGSGTVPAGAVRELSAVFRLPERMWPGRSYAGTLPLNYARYGVRIDVAGTREKTPEAE
jgi:hypothetical protein